MTIIRIDPLGTTTMLTSTSTINETVDDEEAKSTLIAGLTTSLSTTSATQTRNYVQMDVANRYLDSLSDEELEKLDNLLREREKQVVEITLPEKPMDKDLQRLAQLEERVKKVSEKEIPAIPETPIDGTKIYKKNIKIKRKK